MACAVRDGHRSQTQSFSFLRPPIDGTGAGKGGLALCLTLVYAQPPSRAKKKAGVAGLPYTGTQAKRNTQRAKLLRRLADRTNRPHLVQIIRLGRFRERNIPGIGYSGPCLHLLTGISLAHSAIWTFCRTGTMFQSRQYLRQDGFHPHLYMSCAPEPALSFCTGLPVTRWFTQLPLGTQWTCHWALMPWFWRSPAMRRRFLCGGEPFRSGAELCRLSATRSLLVWRN